MRVAFAAFAAALWCVAASAAPFTPIAPDAAYPEGPLILSGKPYWADMGKDAIVTAAPGAKGKWKARAVWRAPGCGPTAIAPYRDGVVALCHMAGALAVIGPDWKERQRISEDRTSGVMLDDPNDAFADGKGGVYFSDPGLFSKDVKPMGRVVHLGADGGLRVVLDAMAYPNGVYVDQARGDVYISEHLARRIWRYRMAPDGALVSGVVFADIDKIAPPSKEPPYREAGPDGLEMAPNGDLVVAIYGEGRFLQITPQGLLRREIPVPIRYVTNIAFRKDGAAIAVGAIENSAPNLRGAVLMLPAATFATQ
jgi:sugar lactone lactonase YvrE